MTNISKRDRLANCSHHLTALNDSQFSVQGLPSRHIVYAPGLDGTGKLIRCQSRLLDHFQMDCVSYPKDLEHDYDSLVDKVVKTVSRKTNHGVIIVGESFGGGVALHVALRRPDLVSGLVLINTFAYYPKRWLVRLILRLRPALPSGPLPKWTRVFREPLLFSHDMPRDRRKWWFHQVRDVRNDHCMHRMKLIESLDLREKLQKITLPTLVIVSPDDRVVPPSCGQELAEHIPNASLVELAGGHTVLSHPRHDFCRVISKKLPA